MQALVPANGVSFSSGDGVVASGEDEGVAQKHSLRRKRKRSKAAETPDSKKLVDEARARISDDEGKVGASESKETVPSSCHKREAEASDGPSGGSTSNDEELSGEEADSEDEDGEKPTAFGRAFQKIMNKKLPSSVLSEAMGPILSAHKQLVAKKLEEAADGRKKRSESKKEKQALREKGHSVPASFAAAKDKELIKLATRGVVKLFNAVSKAQSVQEGAKVTKTTEAKEVAKRSKSTFLAMLQDGNESSFKGRKRPLDDKKETVAERQPGWSALQDTFMLGKSRLKDWDKKQDDEAGVEGTGNSSNDSDSE